MLTVACVYWKGQWKGQPTRYNIDWVANLQHMVARNLTIPNQFVCLTNTMLGNWDCIPLVNNWPGWWSKIELFRPGLFDDKVLYLDLDVLILKNIDDLVMYALTSTADFMLAKGRATHGLNINRGQGLEIRKYQGSVMCFDPRTTSNLYTKFDPQVDILKYCSDQDYIADKLPDQPTFPDQWIRKLEECPDGIPPIETKIVLCNPEKNDVAIKKYPWLKDIWK